MIVYIVQFIRTTMKKKNCTQILVRSSRQCSSPAAGEDALKPSTISMKHLQSFEMGPRVARWRIQHAVKSMNVQVEEDGRRPSLRR